MNKNELEKLPKIDKYKFLLSCPKIFFCFLTFYQKQFNNKESFPRIYFPLFLT